MHSLQSQAWHTLQTGTAANNTSLTILRSLCTDLEDPQNSKRHHLRRRETLFLSSLSSLSLSRFSLSPLSFSFSLFPSFLSLLSLLFTTLCSHRQTSPDTTHRCTASCGAVSCALLVNRTPIPPGVKPVHHAVAGICNRPSALTFVALSTVFQAQCLRQCAPLSSQRSDDHQAREEILRAETPTNL